jgi:hypothetical protein
MALSSLRVDFMAIALAIVQIEEQISRLVCQSFIESINRAIGFILSPLFTTVRTRVWKWSVYWRGTLKKDVRVGNTSAIRKSETSYHPAPPFSVSFPPHRRRSVRSFTIRVSEWRQYICKYACCLLSVNSLFHLPLITNNKAAFDMPPSGLAIIIGAGPNTVSYYSPGLKLAEVVKAFSKET